MRDIETVTGSLHSALRQKVEQSKATAHEQRAEMSEYAEFWRGREGAFEDVLVWIEEAERD